MIKIFLQTILLMVVLFVVGLPILVGIELGLSFTETIGMVGVWIMAALFLGPIAFGMFDYKHKK